MNRLSDEIKGKNEQISLLEKQVADSIMASHNDMDKSGVSQYAELVAQLNEKSFDLEVKVADNRIIQEQLNEKDAEIERLKEKIEELMNLKDQLEHTWNEMHHLLIMEVWIIYLSCSLWLSPLLPLPPGVSRAATWSQIASYSMSISASLATDEKLNSSSGDESNQ